MDRLFDRLFSGLKLSNLHVPSDLVWNKHACTLTDYLVFSCVCVMKQGTKISNACTIVAYDNIVFLARWSYSYGVNVHIVYME